MMEYGTLLYKIKHELAQTKDYIDWALAEIYRGEEDDALFLLASYTEQDDRQLIEAAFRRCQQNRRMPNDAEQLGCYVDECIKSLRKPGDDWEINVSILGRIWLEQGNPESLEIWFMLSEMLDEVYNFNNNTSLTLETIKARAEREANKHVVIYYIHK